MAYKDTRQFIAHLKELGELSVVDLEVDWDCEIGAILRRTFDVYGDASPALLFTNIKDYKSPKPNKLLAGTNRTYSRIGLQMGLPATSKRRDLVREWRNRVKNPITPKMVLTGPCKENKDTGEKIDILKFPAPLWHDRDGGRYIGTFHQVITRDPETGRINVGMYRIQIHDPKTGVILIRPGWQHIGLHYGKYIERDEPMPVSVAIGGPPICSIVACQPFAVGQDEYEMAGALQGEAIEVVSSELSDLPVPATAEIVLEGTIDPRQREMEGPFGEYPGYYGSLPVPKPVFRIECVTYRNDPIFLGTLEGYPINEDHTMMSVGSSAFVLDALETTGVPGVIDVAMPRWASGHLVVIVSIKPTVEGHASIVANRLWSLSDSQWKYKYVIVVDEDIDPWNTDQVFWAIASRTKATESIHIWPRHKGSPCDPRVPPEEKGFWDRVLIDATRPYHWDPRPVWGTKGVGKGIPLKFPPTTRPGLDMMDKVNSRWDKYRIQPMAKISDPGMPYGLLPEWWDSENIEAVKTLKITP